LHNDIFKALTASIQSTPANTNNFCNNLSAYLALNLSPVARKRLLLILDGRQTGYISFSTFQAFVKAGKLSEVVKLHAEGEPWGFLLLKLDLNSVQRFIRSSASLAAMDRR
jgi:hypothetical protein